MPSPTDPSPTDPSMSEVLEAMPARARGRYRPERVLGRGGFGWVVAARDLELARAVALKVLLPGRPSAERGARFAREARITARLSHPHIVRLYDFEVDEAGGKACIAYELVEGQDLRARLLARAPIGLEAVGRWGVALADALAHVHRAGVLHRDVTPGNVLIRKTGEPVLCDFGLARGEGLETLTGTGAVVGTVGYLAPELWRGTLESPASDQYGLGAVLFELVYRCRVHPEPGPEARPVIPPALRGRLPGMEAVLARALAPEPGARFPDLDRLGAALRAATSELDAAGCLVGAAPPGPPSKQLRTPAGPTRVVAPVVAGYRRTGLAALVFAGVLLVGWGILRAGAKVDPPDPSGPAPAPATPAAPAADALATATGELAARARTLATRFPAPAGRGLSPEAGFWPAGPESCEPLLADGFPEAWAGYLAALQRWLEAIRRRERGDSGASPWESRDLEEAFARDAYGPVGYVACLAWRIHGAATRSGPASRPVAGPTRSPWPSWPCWEPRSRSMPFHAPASSNWCDRPPGPWRLPQEASVRVVRFVGMAGRR